MLSIDEMYDILQNDFGVSEQTLNVVTDINGWSEETMEDILYAVSGYRSFEQCGYEDEDEEIEGVGLVSALQPQYDSRASFYGKAQIDDHDDTITLYSYDTKVAEYNKASGNLHVYGYFSATTARHIREFAYQLGITLPSGKNIKGVYHY